MNILKPIDSFLNEITMYRLVLYGLIMLSTVAILFGFLEMLPFSGMQMLTTLGIILTTAYISKIILEKIFKSWSNRESSAITASILFLILAPIVSLEDVYITIGVTVFAIASKYLLAIDKKHIFNPVAIALVVAGLLGFGNGIWWIGSLVLLPFVIVFGLLVVRKIRRLSLLGAFLITAVPTIVLFNFRNGLMISDSLIQVFSSWPLIFFGTVMLTEPLTTPPRTRDFRIYGALVGVLFGLQFHVGPIFSSPELSLVLGNIFSYIVSPKYKMFLTLKEKIKLAPSIYEFIFEKHTKFHFLPGQYFEWTMPEKYSDSRGNRRYFTIASSPTEKDVKLGIKIDTRRSSHFKEGMMEMEIGETIIASQLSGNFVLPQDASQKLVFIAGGIGVTPFRSMIEYLVEKKEKRDIIFFYACSTVEEFVYKDIFAKAVNELDMQMVYVITHTDMAPKGWEGETGHITHDMIKKYTDNPRDYIYYLSGPNAMVEAYKNLLHGMSISRNQIITDYFPGF